MVGPNGQAFVQKDLTGRRWDGHGGGERERGGGDKKKPWPGHV